ncbi:MAG: hypothetical protein AAB601_02180 [Patescibacteria group bacterium]
MVAIIAALISLLVFSRATRLEHQGRAESRRGNRITAAGMLDSAIHTYRFAYGILFIAAACAAAGV